MGFFFFHVAKFIFSLCTTVHALTVSHVPGVMVNAACNKQEAFYLCVTANVYVRYYHHSHFTDRKMEALRSKVTFQPSSCS